VAPVQVILVSRLSYQSFSIQFNPNLEKQKACAGTMMNCFYTGVNGARINNTSLMQCFVVEQPLDNRITINWAYLYSHFSTKL